jgi:hypothetical protein
MGRITLIGKFACVPISKVQERELGKTLRMFLTLFLKLCASQDGKDKYSTNNKVVDVFLACIGHSEFYYVCAHNMSQ